MRDEDKLYDEFNKRFPIEKLPKMTLKEYTAGPDSFCSLVRKVSGSIQSRPENSFGIFLPQEDKESKLLLSDGTYKWEKKYGETSEKAYEEIRKIIVSIANFARKGEYENIDNIKLDAQVRWKIAFLYSEKKLVNWFSREALELFAKYFKEDLGENPKISEIQRMLIRKKGEKNLWDFSKELQTIWNKRENNNKKFWLIKHIYDGAKETEKLANTLKNTRNLILHGAPGTGKTYLAKKIAEEMKAEVCFVQFHPSYDYTDFVEGIRPKQKTEENSSDFELVDGIFKKFCEKALKRSTVNTIDNFEEVWKALVEKLEKDDFIDIDTISGKTKLRIELNEYGNGLANRTYKNDEYKKREWIKGQSKFFNKEQCYNIYKGLPGIPSGGHDAYRKAIVNYMKEKMGLKEYKKGTIPDDPKQQKPFVLIIDEINRGELSKIFGELFFAIDPDYRGVKGKVLTQYANMQTEPNAFDEALNHKSNDSESERTETYGHFFVPQNVHIIGTMNDIDRSVESMDLAMRRRFTFKEISAKESMDMLESEEAWEKTWKKERGVKKEEIPVDKLKNRMKNLNKAIISDGIGLSEAYQIGAAYFLKYASYVNEDNPFECLWNYNLEPLLREYLRGQGDIRDKIKKLKAAYDDEKNTAENKENTATTE